MKRTKRVESWLRVKNRHGQPLSNQWWQDGDVKAKNGVLELWSRGVMEARDAWPFCDAGPEAGVPTKPRERSQVGKGGNEVIKWTGFSRLETASTHLFPHESTQVVDFPLLSRLRVFWLRVERGGGQWTVDNWQWIANSGNESNRTNGTNSATERSLMFAYVRLKSLKFAYFEKKYFFPALWPLITNTPWVGVRFRHNHGLDAGRGSGDFSAREIKTKMINRRRSATNH